MILFWVQFAIFFCCNFVVWLFFSNFFSHYCNQFNVCLFIVDGAVVMIIVYWFVIFPEQTHMEFETDRTTFFCFNGSNIENDDYFFSTNFSINPNKIKTRWWWWWYCPLLLLKQKHLKFLHYKYWPILSKISGVWVLWSIKKMMTWIIYVSVIIILQFQVFFFKKRR